MAGGRTADSWDKLCQPGHHLGCDQVTQGVGSQREALQVESSLAVLDTAPGEKN